MVLYPSMLAELCAPKQFYLDLYYIELSAQPVRRMDFVLLSERDSSVLFPLQHMNV